MPSVSRSTGKTKLIRSFDFSAAGLATTNHVVGVANTLSSAWYLVTLTRDSDSTQQHFQFSVGDTVLSEPDSQKYSVVGEDFDLIFKAIKTGSDLVFEVINSDTSSFSINYIRIMK